MSNWVYCTSDPSQADRYLYLPKSWNEYPWVGVNRTILDVVIDPDYPRLYVLAHGPIWFDSENGDYWRVIMPGGYIPRPGLYLHPVTGLWSSKPEHLPIRAERTDYETLRLEAVFGYSVWGNSGATLIQK